MPVLVLCLYWSLGDEIMDFYFLLIIFLPKKNIFFCSTIDFLNAHNRVKLSSWSKMSFLKILSFPFFLMLCVIIFTVGFLSFKVMQKMFLVFQSIVKTDIIHINKFSMMIYMFNLFLLVSSPGGRFLDQIPFTMNIY